MSRYIILLLLAVMLSSACTSTSQYTSGETYLAKYEHPAYNGQSNIDNEIRDIAAIEPRIEFPARIGLARIEGGQLRSVPTDEAASWYSFIANLGDEMGEIVPVSPLVAAMVSSRATGQGEYSTSAQKVVNQIRRGSARQHLDYVLIYEVSEKDKQKSNALRLTDLTVLGLYVLPSRSITVEATASAMLIDVRNGYPYGTATAFADKDAISTFAGRGTKRAKLSDKARLTAVDRLTDEVTIFMNELKTHSGSSTQRVTQE